MNLRQQFGFSNERRVHFLLSCMDLTILICRSALLLSNDRTHAYAAYAKKAYGVALKSAGKLSFTVHDVSKFESRSMRLEDLIKRLGKRHDRDTERPVFDLDPSQA